MGLENIRGWRISVALSGMVFPHEDIHFFTKSAAKLVSGFDYSHEDIARFASK